ncbi:hypothetical protein D1007_00179 [Hordeum vulgare]|nr:hypothetical protein D1007_00179 [Hordeum vulgare]
MEGMMVMACPVLIAIVRGSAESMQARGVAGATLLAGILQFVVICLPKTVNIRLCGLSKLLIHMCVVFLMWLASVVMSLVGLKCTWAYVLAVLFILFCSACMAYLSLQRPDMQEKMSTADFMEFKRSLDASANLFSAVTTVMFVGLEALALEGLVKGDANGLVLPMVSSFVTCAVGVLSMVLVSVHPLIDSENDGMKPFLQRLSVGLALCVCLVVYYFTQATLGYSKAALLFTPACLPFLVWIFSALQSNGNENQETASLELTKITFAAFLVVSITAKANSMGDCLLTTLFLCSTAAAIVTGIEWRLITHWKEVPVALARAADAACFLSHVCMAFAVIPFALMAAAVVKKPQGCIPA